MVASFLFFFAIRTSTSSFCLQAVAMAALLLTMEEINKINNLIIIKHTIEGEFYQKWILVQRWRWRWRWQLSSWQWKKWIRYII